MEERALQMFENEMTKKLDSKGFWRWCITLGIAKLLDFVHRPVF
jgi:hypothetical protein